MDFRNKIVVLTGGTGGIGKAICKEFLSEGAKVIFIYSSNDLSAKNLKNSLPGELQKNLFFYKGSVADLEFVKYFFQDLESNFPKLDILINCAGINIDKLFLEMETNDWTKVLDTNLRGTFLMNFFAKNLLQKTEEKSYIVNFSSISGVFGRSGQANYAMSKGGIIGLTKLFAKKYVAQNTNVNCVAPGLIKTEMLDNMPTEKINEILDFTIQKKMGETIDVVNLVKFLCSGKADYITGNCLRLDGGFCK